MKRLITGFVSVAFVLVFFRVAYGSITYNLVEYPGDENGCTLTGSITTDGTIGLISANNVVAWSYTITDTVFGNYTCTIQSGDSSSNIPYFSSVDATATQLFALQTPTSEVILQSETANGISAIDWINSSSVGGEIYRGYGPGYALSFNVGLGEPSWLTVNPEMNGAQPWVIAHTTTVPEPSSLIIFAGLCAMGRGLYGWKKGKWWLV